MTVSPGFAATQPGLHTPHLMTSERLLAQRGDEVVAHHLRRCLLSLWKRIADPCRSAALDVLGSVLGVARILVPSRPSNQLRSLSERSRDWGCDGAHHDDDRRWRRIAAGRPEDSPTALFLRLARIL